MEKIISSTDWSNYGIQINDKMLSELRFADDVILISQKKKELLKMTKEFFESSNAAGLTPNIEKQKS